MIRLFLFFASQIEFLESELADLATLEFDWHLLLLNQTHLMWMDSLLSVRRNSLWWNFCSHSITYFNIVCYMVQAPLWRHAYRSPFQASRLRRGSPPLHGHVLFRDAQIILSCWKDIFLLAGAHQNLSGTDWKGNLQTYDFSLCTPPCPLEQI